MLQDREQMASLTPQQKAKVALKHLLTLIRDDERVAHLIGPGSQTFDLATEAYASLMEIDLTALRIIVGESGKVLGRSGGNG